MAINPFFNAEYYLATNLDLIRAGFTASNDEGKAALWNHYTTYGAQEALQVANQNTLREPSPWFNVDYYLQANPDLGAAGIGAGQALNHYYQYGVFEGRQFSATVRADSFDAQSYAANHVDLREAFGIEDNTPLTTKQVGLLLQHYLAFGYLENRDGAGEIATQIRVDNMIVVGARKGGDGITLGTIGDDVFEVTTNLADTTVSHTAKLQFIDGLGGVDTVHFKANQTTDEPVTLRNIEKVVADVANAGDVHFNSTKAVDLTVKQATGNITAKFSDLKGTNDVFNIVTEAHVNSIGTMGIETMNLVLNGGAPALLYLNNAQGENLTVNIAGEGAGATITVGSQGSVHVKTVTIDASASTGALNLVASDGSVSVGEDVVGSLANIQNIVMKGGAGANTFTGVAIDASKNFTATGGAGADTFNGSKAIDTFTGDTGNDSFAFAAGTAVARLSADKKAIVAVDTIVDFKAGDQVKLAETVNTIATLTVKAGQTLEELVTEAFTGEAAVFNWRGDAYVLVQNGTLSDKEFTASPELIKLAGVDANKLDVDAGAIVLA